MKCVARAVAEYQTPAVPMLGTQTICLGHTTAAAGIPTTELLRRHPGHIERILSCSLQDFMKRSLLYVSVINCQREVRVQSQLLRGGVKRRSVFYKQVGGSVEDV
jgi:hypothetical protein